MAAKVHLQVVSPNEVNFPVRTVPSQIARLVDSVLRPLGEWIDDKALGRQRLIIQIPIRKIGRADMDFSDLADSGHLALRVEQEHLDAFDSFADGHADLHIVVVRPVCL